MTIESGVPDVTLALFETEPVAVVAIEYVLTIVALWPAASEANEHG